MDGFQRHLLVQHRHGWVNGERCRCGLDKSTLAWPKYHRIGPNPRTSTIMECWLMSETRLHVVGMRGSISRRIATWKR